MAGRCGWLQSELQQTRARLEIAEQEIRLLKAPDSLEANGLRQTDPASPPTSHPHQSAPTANGHDLGAECPPRPPWWKFWTKFMVLFV